MTELKTLKDLFPEPRGVLDDVFVDGIKKEAIKWFKSIMKRSGDMWEITGKLDWMEFFNITDEDLK